MTIAAALILIASALFSFAVWPTFYRRVAKDPRARDASGRASTFLRVHAVLISIALVLGAGSLVAGALLLAGFR